ncbi:hypothetical protein BC828DRAFT_337497, partial [Blastocladiella britannica]
FLNDLNLEFYLKYLLNEVVPSMAPSVHVFSSFFYSRLTSIRGDKAFARGYDLVKRHAKNVDLFTKRIVVVPINENLHWYLAII